jgi:hypothetical protein
LLSVLIIIKTELEAGLYTTGRYRLPQPLAQLAIALLTDHKSNEVSVLRTVSHHGAAICHEGGLKRKQNFNNVTVLKPLMNNKKNLIRKQNI